MLTMYPLSIVLAASIVSASGSTLRVDRANSMFNREQFVIKKGLGLALLNKIKSPLVQTAPVTFHYQNMPVAMSRQRVISNFHPMVRLRSETMQGDDPYHAPPNEVDLQGGAPKSFDDKDGFKMFEEEQEVDDVFQRSLNLGDDSFDNVALSDLEPVDYNQPGGQE